MLWFKAQCCTLSHEDEREKKHPAQHPGCRGFLWLAGIKKGKCVGGLLQPHKLRPEQPQSERGRGCLMLRGLKHLMTAGYITDYVTWKSIRRRIVSGFKMTNQIWLMHYFLVGEWLFPWCCKSTAICTLQMKVRNDHSVMARCKEGK